MSEEQATREYNRLVNLGNAIAGVMVVKPEKWPFPELPSLPRNLRFLDARNLQLETLPHLPPTLIILHLSGNKKLKSLPTLPPLLEQLMIDDTGITELPILPFYLERLEVQNSQITALPELPSRLTALMCYNTSLQALPKLPASLRFLNCAETQITALPTLPTGLSSLACGSCKLRVLPRLHFLLTVQCLSNPWCPEFAAIFPPLANLLGYLGASYEQKAAVNAYHDIQDIKATARDVLNVRTTIARADAIPDDVANVIGSYFSGNNTTLSHQIGVLRDLVHA